MQIEIQIPKPGVMLLAIAALSGWAMYWGSGGTNAQTATIIEAPPIAQVAPVQPAVAPVPPPQGPVHAAAVVTSDADVHEDDGGTNLTQAEIRVKWARAEQDFLRRKNDILRLQLKNLQEVSEQLGPDADPRIQEEMRRSVQQLTGYAKQEKDLEAALRLYYQQMLQAQEDAMQISKEQTSRTSGKIVLQWPVIGPISAHFRDEGYRDLLGLEHWGLDIAVVKGTTVVSAADGIVKKIVNHGYGVNYVIVESDGFTLSYLHLSEIAVTLGQRVRTGQKIGESGGRPGDEGSGFSTGEHLHVEMHVGGVPVDPLKYLSKNEE